MSHLRAVRGARSIVERSVVLAVLISAACGTASAPSSAPATAAPTSGATPTSAPAATATWPLRGIAEKDASAIRRRPIAVRIPNDTAARPQAGLSSADMVWELIAEGGITRYMVVFHSQEADQVGPIRSARLSDLHYLPMLRGILAHVGASGPVLQRVRAAASSGSFVDFDQFVYAAYYQRVTFRPAPQNVYTSTKRLREGATSAGDKGNVDVPALAFGSAPSGGAEGTTFTIPYLGPTRVTYTYEDAASGYRRTQNGTRTTDAATNQPVLAQNVIVIYTDITEVPGIVEDELGSLSLDIRSTGTGKATVFRGGNRYDGTWSRQGTDMYKFAAESGPIALAPGQTWVHVIPSHWTVTNAP